MHVSLSSDFVRGDNTDTDTPLPWIPPVRAVYGVRLEPETVPWVQDAYVGIRGESVAKQTRLDPLDTVVSSYTLAHAEAGVTRLTAIYLGREAPRIGLVSPVENGGKL